MTGVKRHHIYTVVLGKNSKPLIILFFVSVILSIYLCYFIFCRQPELYGKFTKESIKMVYSLSGKADEGTDFFIHFGVDTVMKNCSPAFTDSEKSLPVFNILSKDDKEDNTDLSVQKKADKKVNINTSSVASKNLSLKNETSYSVDAENLVNIERVYSAIGNEPKILIMHTHACETYSNESGVGLGASGTYRTTDIHKNIISIGNELEKCLKNEGLSVIHDYTLCDYPAYNNSYKNSMVLIEKYKKLYPSIEFVFDIHRDAIADDSGTPTKLTCKINGETVSQAMIVCGTDSMGLSHPYWKDNLILALKIQKNLEKKYPGFMRPVNIRKERFNMHETKGSLIFEIGTHGNTQKEAKDAVRYLADGIAATLKNET